SLPADRLAVVGEGDDVGVDRRNTSDDVGAGGNGARGGNEIHQHVVRLHVQARIGDRRDVEIVADGAVDAGVGDPIVQITDELTRVRTPYVARSADNRIGRADGHVTRFFD